MKTDLPQKGDILPWAHRNNMHLTWKQGCWWYFQWADENKPMKMTMIVLWTDYTFVMK